MKNATAFELQRVISSRMMFNMFCLLVLVLFSSTYAQKNVCDFRSSGIVPQILSAVPPQRMQIEYNDAPVICGNLIDRAMAMNPPTSVKYEADKNKLYTLIMFDPDIPYPKDPHSAPFRHWLIENIPGDDLQNGDTVSSYHEIVPPPTSEPHRYVFVVYEQPKKLNDEFDNSEAGRKHFDVQKFIDERNLQGPIAGNFYYGYTSNM